MKNSEILSAKIIYQDIDQILDILINIDFSNFKKASDIIFYFYNNKYIAKYNLLENDCQYLIDYKIFGEKFKQFYNSYYGNRDLKLSIILNKLLKTSGIEIYSINNYIMIQRICDHNQL